MTLHEHLRATRKAVYPAIIEYRTTDPRVVDAVRLLDPAADEIERLLKTVAAIREHADKMAAALNAAAVKSSGRDNSVDLLASRYGIALLYINRGEVPPA